MTQAALDKAGPDPSQITHDARQGRSDAATDGQAVSSEPVVEECFDQSGGF